MHACELVYNPVNNTSPRKKLRFGGTQYFYQETVIRNSGFSELKRFQEALSTNNAIIYSGTKNICVLVEEILLCTLFSNIVSEMGIIRINNKLIVYQHLLSLHISEQ